MFIRRFVAAIFLALAACASVPDASLPTVGQVEYRIGPGDRLALSVFREESLSGEFTVNELGVASLPLVGDIQAAGKTLPEFRADLVTLLGSEFVRDPNVTVNVVNYRPVYVLGEVTRPGEYAYNERMTVYALVAMAGGFTYRANQNIAMVRHENDPEERAYELTSGAAVLPGDTIRFVQRYF
jgi:polysaccharide export outer membrane protein